MKMMGILLIASILLLGCLASSPLTSKNVNNTTGEGAQIANPASVYCVEHNGTLEIRKDSEGGEYGMCIFKNGNECDEWAFFRGECGPEGNKSTQPNNTQTDNSQVQIANPASVYCIEHNGTLEIRESKAGQRGICVFQDKSECDEWAFFRGECKQDENFCKDLCGDGTCEEVVCEAVGCPCAETPESCPEDCTKTG